MIKIITLLILVNYCLSQQPRSTIQNIISRNQPIEILAKFEMGNSLLHQLTFQLTYNQSEPPIHRTLDFNLTLPLEDNITVTTQLYRYLGPQTKELVNSQKRNLTRYQKIKIKQQDESLLTSYDPMDQIQSLSRNRQAKQKQNKYDMHIPQNFQIMLVVSHYAFPGGQLVPHYRLKSRNYQGSPYYLPPIGLGQLHIPTTKSLQIAQNNTVNIQLFTYSYQKYIYFYSIAYPEIAFQAIGPVAELLDMKEDSMDVIKQLMFQNPLWLIILYFVLSFAQTILKFATIKSEFNFWKNIDKNKGISLKTLFFQLIAQTIILLYLYQYDSGKLILFFNFLDILVTIWKITRTYSLTLKQQFPFIRITTSQLYKQRQQIDGNAIWYMNYLLVPLMTLYLLYALYKRNWTVIYYYRFALETAVAFIAIFGFILMTPQLYINYKLKSVQHLNWRGLIYRFVTTIIDDVFAFMVTMPMLRRLMYFRDDIIFIIYVYQRSIYKVDYSRKSMFTSDEPTTITTKQD